MKHVTYTRFIIIITAFFSLSSCLKKDDIPDLSKVAPVIEFPLGGPGLVKNILSGYSSDVVDTVIALNIASPDPLGNDVTVSIKADPAVVDAYNTANGTTYTALPASLFQIESTNITIKAGYRIGRIKVKIRFDQFDPTQKYILALSITSAPGLIISKNFGSFLWEFVVKSQYEGNFHSTGEIKLYNGPDEASGVGSSRMFDEMIAASTVNATTLEAQIADLSNVMDLAIDPATNNVTVSPAATNSFAVVQNNGSCTYDPATKTFTLNFKYYNGAGNLRTITQTMVKQ